MGSEKSKSITKKYIASVGKTAMSRGTIPIVSIFRTTAKHRELKPDQMIIVAIDEEAKRDWLRMTSILASAQVIVPEKKSAKRKR